MTLADQILQHLITGLTTGSVFAIIALGFNIIYNTSEIINFAQGEFVVIGGLVMAATANALLLPQPVGFLLTLFALFVLGVVVERLAIHPQRDAPLLTLIVITIGLSVLLRGSAMFVWGKGSHVFPAFSGTQPIALAGAAIQPQAFWILGTMIGVIVLLNLFFRRTVLGIAMRACAANRRAASLVGINVARMTMMSFGLGAALGAVAGIVITPMIFIEYDRGLMFALKGFSAAILGGLGSYWGAVVAGILLGTMESMTAGFLSSAYKDAVALVVLLVVLVVRPRGMFGRAEM